jgi:hypothetical protein
MYTVWRLEVEGERGLHGCECMLLPAHAMRPMHPCMQPCTMPAPAMQRAVHGANGGQSTPSLHGAVGLMSTEGTLAVTASLQARPRRSRTPPLDHPAAPAQPPRYTSGTARAYDTLLLARRGSTPQRAEGGGPAAAPPTASPHHYHSPGRPTTPPRAAHPGPPIACSLPEGSPVSFGMAMLARVQGLVRGFLPWSQL